MSGFSVDLLIDANTGEAHAPIAKYIQYKDIKGKLLLEKQADRKKTPDSLEEVPKLCSSLREAVAAYEEKLIWQALEAAHGNISEAARILDVPMQTLQRKASQLRGEKAKEKQEKEI